MTCPFTSNIASFLSFHSLTQTNLIIFHLITCISHSLIITHYLYLSLTHSLSHLVCGITFRVFSFQALNCLALSGSSHRIGDLNNGNFLGLNELPSRWDPILQERVQNATAYQEKGERLQAHYLSPESQNEFISACSSRVTQHILLESIN